MAYMNQELKAKLAPAIKAVCKKFGVKATLAVCHHSTLVLNIKSGPIDFIASRNRVMAANSVTDSTPAVGYLDVNPYHFKNHFDGAALEFLEQVLSAMNVGNHNRSDLMTDYFDVGWYVDVNVGQWDKPYELI
jgi:hypothetical protein